MGHSGDDAVHWNSNKMKTHWPNWLKFLVLVYFIILFRTRYKEIDVIAYLSNAPLITHIVNLSIEYAVVPLCCSAWFESYLSNRQQIVEINGVRSDLMQLSCGVPQRSLSVPCYTFAIVMTWSLRLKTNCSCMQMIVLSFHQIQIRMWLLVTWAWDLESCNNWLINNKLSLHVGKTWLILFGSRKQLKQVANFHVSYNGYDIQPVSSLKYLGVIIDQHLSGQAMVESIIKKATILCSALLQCHLEYCCTSWFHGLSKYHQQKLQIFQNKMIWYIMHLGPRDHVGQDQFELKTCGATRNNRVSPGPDRTRPKPVRDRGTVLKFFSGRVGEFYFGSVRVGVFFYQLWDIFSRDFGDKLAFHSQTEEVNGYYPWQARWLML